MDLGEMSMHLTRRLVLVGGLSFGLAACANSRFRTYDGPEVTRVRLFKSDRNLFVYSGDRILKTYKTDLGFAPKGHKQFEGDGKTPEGSYIIDRHNPKSLFHLSVGISYPNEADIAFAKAQGREPGGEIFIHGGPRRGIDQIKSDWTA
jgi:murein L,D-transpeptidase YafK